MASRPVWLRTLAERTSVAAGERGPPQEPAPMARQMLDSNIATKDGRILQEGCGLPRKTEIGRWPSGSGPTQPGLRRGPACAAEVAHRARLPIAIPIAR